jgi:hypothetical protein
MACDALKLFKESDLPPNTGRGRTSGDVPTRSATSATSADPLFGVWNATNTDLSIDLQRDGVLEEYVSYTKTDGTTAILHTTGHYSRGSKRLVVEILGGIDFIQNVSSYVLDGDVLSLTTAKGITWTFVRPHR